MKQNIWALALGLLAIILTVLGVKYVANPNSVEVPVLSGLVVTITEDNINAIANAILVKQTTGIIEEVAEKEVDEFGEVEETPIVEASETIQKTFYSTVQSTYRFELPVNSSRLVFRQLTGIDFMRGLNSIKIKAPAEATTAELTVTLGREWEALKNAMYTWNIQIGYETCKVNEVLDRNMFPHTRTVDLTAVDCKNRGIKNFLPLLQEWTTLAIYNAQLDWITYDWVIVFE